jgi:mono/diheme cytochrome c family protein
MSLLSFVLLASCTVQTTKKEAVKSTAIASVGSCVQNDSTNNSTLCFERSHPTEFDNVMCKAAQGMWSTEVCPQSQYDRICKQETIETIDDGEPQTVLYTYYFKKDSNFFCAGEEIVMGSGAEAPTDAKPSPMEDSPTTPVANGQSLYAERACVTCHGAIATSSLRGFSAESIIRAYDAAQHSNVIWPSAEEALAIRDALDLSRSEWIALGQARYEFTCQSCHQAIDQSTIVDQSFAGISKARSLMPHQNVSWPLEKESRALEKALQEP